ncbi:cytochrome P450 [Streptomyces virginiae]|uniref:cytochrome P450 n=1 Tax=Streptomyces virginiae TaxID=1961 RepID=UPI0033B48D41
MRRCYPFVPVGGLAARDLRFASQNVAEGTLVLLDVPGHHRDPDLWPEPLRFNPRRFLGVRQPGGPRVRPAGAGPAHSCHPGPDPAPQRRERADPVPDHAPCLRPVASPDHVGRRPVSPSGSMGDAGAPRGAHDGLVHTVDEGNRRAQRIQPQA